MSHSLRPLSYDNLRHLLPQRARDSHKGSFGHVLVVGGAPGFGGAALLAAEAAARTGAGLTSVATYPGHVTALFSRRPELMVHGADDPDVINVLLARATALVAGPGLGQEAWGLGLLQAALQGALKQALPLVMDADALNLLSAGRLGTGLSNYSKWILTPHPGEAARLLQLPLAAIESDREGAARALQLRFGGIAVLKGAGTLVCFDQHGRQQVEACVHGNPGMATGGMGDVLSGIIGALLAQGFAPADAARLGVSLHSKAADLEAAAHGERGMLASDLFPHLRTLLNP
jgi:hydroxyethylthiazole kinase-like uncharacterized protein yjeF